MPNAKEEVKATKEDYLFIKPGGEWYRVRQLTKWNSKRHLELAMAYSALTSDTDKRDFARGMIRMVKENGGRFLHGDDVEQYDRGIRMPNKPVWTVLDDDEKIIDRLMQVLRQRKKLREREVNDMISNLRSMEEQLDDLGTQIQEIRKRARNLRGAFSCNDDKGQDAAPTSAAIGNGPIITKDGTAAKRRKVMSMIDKMLNTATMCAESLDRWVETENDNDDDGDAPQNDAFVEDTSGESTSGLDGDASVENAMLV